MIIEVDKYKEFIFGYDLNHSDDVHIESAKLADQEFERFLKEKKFKEIIFMSGGTASGKTEFVAQNYREIADILVLDATMKNIESFQIKYKLIKKYQHENVIVKIVHVAPFIWVNALAAFYGRERQMKLENFWITHVNSKMTLAKIIEKYEDVIVELYISTYPNKKCNFEIASMDNWSKKEKIEFIKNLGLKIEKEFELYK